MDAVLSRKAARMALCAFSERPITNVGLKELGMKLDTLSFVPTRWIFATCLGGAIFASSLQAQDTQQNTQPPQDTPQPAQPQPQSPAQEQNAQVELQINDHTRTFVVHLPQGYDSQQHYPVVILLHGRDQDAAEMARLTHFNEFADRDSIIAVYPNAMNGRWNIGVGQPQV